MKQELKQYYNTFKQDFESLQKEVNFFIDSLRNEKNLNIDIANVYTREYGIKSFKSIETNYQTGRYKDNLDLLDIYDIAGIRIICHCQDDVSALTQRLRGELQQRRYLKIKVKEKGGGKKSEYPYKATHITFAKNIKKNEKTYQIFCEIQIRTVMADAWAVQNHKYLYKKQEEGDTNELTRAVSEIMNGCDTLWSLVKKRSTEHEKGYVQKPLEVIRKKSDSSLKSISPNVRIIKWFDSHKKKASKGLQNLRIKTFMEVEVQLLDSDTNINKNDLKEGARESQVRTSGWPIGVFFDHPKDAPKPDQAGIFAEISIEGRPSYDYWAIHRSVAFYSKMSLFENQGSKLFFDERILRITEVFMYIKNLYTNFSIPMNSKIQVMIKHGGLKGRILSSSSPLRPLFDQYKTEEEKTFETINITLEEIENNMTDIVEKFTTPLFELFNFFNLKKTTLHKIVSDYLQGKLPY